MIEKPAKDIVREIVESNPFWEHFICIKGEIKESSQGLYIEMSGHNTIPVDAGKAVIRPDGVRKYYGFLNFRDQEGFGEHKSARIDNVHFEMGSLLLRRESSTKWMFLNIYSESGVKERK